MLTNGPFLAIAAGGSHSCAIKTNGQAQCWGLNSSDQAPKLTNGPFLAIAAGGSHTCALRTSGKTECWGLDGSGRTAPPDGFTARTDPDVVWLAEKTQLITPTPQIQAHTAYQVIPEGTAAIISFQPTDIAAGDSVTLGLSKTGDGASRAVLSANSITLTSAAPKAQAIITVADNPDIQGSTLSFTVDFTLNSGTLDGKPPDLPLALTFTIPPNDLQAGYKEPPPRIIESNSKDFELLIRGLASKKSFLVSSQDPDIVVSPPGIVSVMDSILSITFTHRYSSVTEFTLPDLNLTHLQTCLLYTSDAADE